ncbi:hypothetical protein ALC56_02037 [Trachymyrmex septentrionalis]|uniref:Uncharacterized protein n=1 Tax=Trachymyrmex septentrionalis TaxID=34720 RepID=A0A195FV80_9HYME|nr:hypothetical protein ALC56_02037 [Trachymyrmex septentrionalis]
MRELVLRVVSVRLYDSLLPPVVPPLRDETFAMRRGSRRNMAFSQKAEVTVQE